MEGEDREEAMEEDREGAVEWEEEEERDGTIEWAEEMERKEERDEGRGRFATGA